MEHDPLRQLAADIRLDTIPVAAYVVHPDGRFAYCNSKARELLDLPRAGVIEDSLKRFYVNQKDRERLLEAVEKQGGVEKQTVPFRTHKRATLIVQIHCRSILDPSNAIIGYLGCLVDVTDEERYRQNLPVGVYRVDIDGVVDYANPALVSMLNYSSPDEFVGRIKVSQLYADPAAESDFRAMLRENGFVVNQKVELVKKTGETLWASASAYLLTGHDDGSEAREGVLVDVTLEERYRQILEDVPIALYMVRTESGRNVIKHCNPQFNEMFEFRGPKGAVGHLAEEVHGPGETQRLETHITECDAKEIAVTKFEMKAKKQSGTPMTIEVNCRPIHNKEGDPIGRVGALLDITKETELAHTIQELSADIASVIHGLGSMLAEVKLLAEVAMDAIGPDVFDRSHELSIEDAATALSEPARKLREQIEEVLDIVSHEPSRQAALPPESWAFLRRKAQQLATLRIEVDPASQPATLREAVSDVEKIVAQIQTGALPRDATRAVRRHSGEILRRDAWCSLQSARDSLIGSNQALVALREFATTYQRASEPKTVHGFEALVDRAIRALSEYATSRSVDFKRDYSAPEAQVRVSDRDVVRAITNLLHNAVKYSWSRKIGSQPWVGIRTQVVDGCAVLEIENFGVPIPKEEIEHGAIFQVGFRGRFAEDRGRLGTGIGLSDARRVIVRHGGEVTIKSRPAHSGGAPDNYDQPFLTTATLRLNLAPRNEVE